MNTQNHSFTGSIEKNHKATKNNGINPDLSVGNTLKIINTSDSSASPQQFVYNWKDSFIKRMRTMSGSKKRNFDYADAIGCTSFIEEPKDKLLIRYIDFITSRPLKQNDYFKYVNSYMGGKELDLYYFKHDPVKLKAYYKKVDNKKKENQTYTAFSEKHWKEYVLFMMLKLEGLYRIEFDKMFRVKMTGDREFNPITNLASVMRPYLPFRIKEYDIKQAYPSFACLDVGIKPIDDIYKKLEKKKLNRLLNTNKENGGSIAAVRNELKPAFGKYTDKILTENRFNTKGQVFRDFAKYEREYIERFAEKNDLKKYVRLHDGVVVKKEIECETLKIGQIEFKVKAIEEPDVVNNKVTWYDDNFKTSASLFKGWFIQEGFERISEEERDELRVIKNERKILTLFNNKTDVLGILAGHINEFDSSHLENQLAKDYQKIQRAFELLPAKPYRLHRDTKDTCFFSFKNGVAKVTSGNVEMIPYEDERIGFFAKHKQTQEHKFEYSIEFADKTPFKNFIASAAIGKEITDDLELSNEDEQRFLAFCTVIGYLVSNYKNPSETFAIILSDEGANNQSRKGGRGKSLLQTALEQVRLCHEKTGVAFDPKYTHNYAALKKEEGIYIIDDAPAKLNYNSLFSNITGSLTAERKGKPSEQIPFEYAPKFVISTNYAVWKDKEADSTNRRFREYQFSKFWNKENKPSTYFGHNFFTDWDKDQWNDFYCFIVWCVQQFLQYGLIQIDNDKAKDNYNASFGNDVIVDEFERVLIVLKSKNDGFTVTEFIKEHKQENPHQSDRIFHRNNVKRYLEVYADYHKLPLAQDNRRIWHFEGSMNNDDSDDLQF